MIIGYNENAFITRRLRKVRNKSLAKHALIRFNSNTNTIHFPCGNSPFKATNATLTSISFWLC